MDQRRIEALLKEVASSYRRRRAAKNGAHPRPNRGSIRAAEINRLCNLRYGHTLPDGETARAVIRIMADTLVWSAGKSEARGKIQKWLEVRAPWLRTEEVAEIAGNAIGRRKYWKADPLADALDLLPTERDALGISTIGAAGMTKRQRKVLRKARKRFKERERRRTNGAKPRDQYAWAARAQPWKHQGISRATYYRRRAGGLQQAAE